MADVLAVRTTDQRVRAARLYAMRFVAPGIAIVVQGLLLRLIGLGGVGTYAVLNTIVGLLAVLGTRGAPQALSRSLATVSDRAVALGRYRETNRVIFLTMAGLVTGFVLVGPFALPLLDIDIHIVTIIVVGLTSVAFAAHSVYLGAARGLDRLTTATGVDLLLGRSLFAAFLLVAWIVADRKGWNVGLSGVLVGLLLTTTAGVSIGAAWIWGRQLWLGPDRYGAATQEGDPSPSETEPPVTNSVLLANQVVLYLAGVFGLWVLHRVASPEEAGAFHVANRLALVAGVPAVVAQFLLGPRLARAAAADSLTELAPTLRRHVAFASIATAILGALLFVAGPTVIDVIAGQRLTIPIGTPMFILLAGQLFHAAAGPCGYALIMAGEERRTLLATVLGTVTVLGLAAVAVPTWGTTGAAVATSVGVVVTNTVNLIGLWRARTITTIAQFGFRVTGRS